MIFSRENPPLEKKKLISGVVSLRTVPYWSVWIEWQKMFSARIFFSFRRRIMRSLSERTGVSRNRRQSTTTEEILIARGFRRQSTTEEMMRCRNFRRQSTQSEELSRTRGRRDSCAQIIDGTVATMTVETTVAFYDTSTQTGENI